MNPIYLDYNATTPVDPDVYATILPFLGDLRGETYGHFGNPSSTHAYGKTAHEVVERARKRVADLLGAQPGEIVFTSGGTEASNHALKGAVLAKMLAGAKTHVITSAIEHPATLQPCEFLRKMGCKITILPVDGHGLVDPDAVRRSLTRETTIVSIMHSNNEVGTLQPIEAIAKIVKEHGALIHTDAAQSLGKVSVDANELRVDLLSVAGHKLYAPKGVGVLFVRRGVQFDPFMHGAGHEGGRRAGTENVPYIAGLGMACEKIRNLGTKVGLFLKEMRDRLWEHLQEGLGKKVALNGHPELRLPNTLNVNFVGWIGADLLKKVPEIAASTGSACHEGHVALSPVLAAMGVSPELGQGAVRLTVGRFTTEDEVDRAAAALIQAVQARKRS